MLPQQEFKMEEIIVALIIFLLDRTKHGVSHSVSYTAEILHLISF